MWRKIVTTVGCHGYRRPGTLVFLALLLSLTATWTIVQPQMRLRAAHDRMLGPVATVAEVERELAHDPVAWRGRIVLVRGRAVDDRTWLAPDSLVTRLALVDPAHMPSTWLLYVAWSRPDPLLTALRHLPLVGSLMPPPQRPQWNRLAVYRLQLCAPAGCTPGADAVLLDADPDAR